MLFNRADTLKFPGVPSIFGVGDITVSAYAPAHILVDKLNLVHLNIGVVIGQFHSLPGCSTIGSALPEVSVTHQPAVIGIHEINHGTSPGHLNIDLRPGHTTIGGAEGDRWSANCPFIVARNETKIAIDEFNIFDVVIAKEIERITD